MSIREFAERYKQLGYPVNPFLMRQVFLTDVSTSTLVWDESDYLVELYFMHPLAVVVPHSHPFENLAIHAGGKMLGRRQGLIGNWLTDRDSGHISNPLAPGAWHAFDVGDSGAVFYNVSRWENHSDKDSATKKYIGNALGPKHQMTLQSIDRASSLVSDLRPQDIV